MVELRPPMKVGPGNMPRIRTLTGADLSAALRAGLTDFLEAPVFGLCFGALFAALGLTITAALGWVHVPWLVIPAAIGFPLVGPFAAVGLYEVSRCRERHKRPSWRAVLGMTFERRGQVGWMAFVVLFIFYLWMYQIRLLLALFMGTLGFSTLYGFFHVVTTTPEGLAFVMVGSLVGAVLAAVLFSVTVIAMPLVVDRDVDVVTAMITSVRAVRWNAGPMLGWAALLAGLLFVAMLPAFVGLVLVLPVLGHATWHLYRRTIDA